MGSRLEAALEAIGEQRRAYAPFTPLTEDEVKRAVQAIQDAIGEWGSDRLHAQWARLVLDNTERNVRAVAAGAPPLHAVHREESIMTEKCPWSDHGMHHYVAVVEQEVRTTSGETTTATYKQVIFCVHCGNKL